MIIFSAFFVLLTLTFHITDNLNCKLLVRSTCNAKGAVFCFIKVCLFPTHYLNNSSIPKTIAAKHNIFNIHASMIMHTFSNMRLSTILIDALGDLHALMCIFI